MGLIKMMKRSSVPPEKETETPHWGVYKGNLPSSLFTTHTRMIDNPEVSAGINIICDIVSNMSIRLMENGPNGNKRLFNNLSRILDIVPNDFMTRKAFIYAVTHSLIVNGNQVSIPYYNRDLESLMTVPYEDVQFFKKDIGYYLEIKGKKFNNKDLLHFVLNPTGESPFVGRGYSLPLKDLLANLKKASNMKQTFLGGQYTPPIIISVNSQEKKLSSKAGRAEILDDYVTTVNAGDPWILPADMMSVESVKPITLRDVHINETIELDKKTVAAILGIPAFLLGVGKFNRDEYNNMIETKVMSIVEILQQEFTRKLIDGKENPSWFIKLNSMSAKSFNHNERIDNALALRAQGVLTGNELRIIDGYDPVDGLDEFVMLENYIPTDRLGDQKKLKDTIKNENEDREGGD